MNALQVTNLPVRRLEHIRADSIWAHRASGLRGALIKISENLEAGKEVDSDRAFSFVRMPQKNCNGTRRTRNGDLVK
jgi:hypothetical protein